MTGAADVELLPLPKPQCSRWTPRWNRRMTMREVQLRFITEVLCPNSGGTLVYPRMSDEWAEAMREAGYIVTNTEEEYE